MFDVIAEEQDALQSTATSTTVTATRKRKRRPGKCHACGKPMLGHNAAACKSKKWKFGGQCVLCTIKEITSHNCDTLVSAATKYSFLDEMVYIFGLKGGRGWISSSLVFFWLLQGIFLHSVCASTVVSVLGSTKI